MEGLVNEVLVVGSAFIGSFLTGLLKKGTSKVDVRLTALYKPVQPAVALGLTLALPILGNALGITEIPSADVFATAPTATVGIIALREVLKKLKKKGGTS